jgi:predicted SnoaL-like aldol condensation-catalyzing enzyme
MRLSLAAACFATLTATALAQLPVEIAANQPALLDSDDALLAANKQLVFDFWRVVRQAHRVDRASEYLAESYIEHDPTIGTSRADMLATASQSPPETIKTTIDELVGIVAEHDLVVLALRRELFDLENEGQTYTTTSFELFRVAGGKIVEHWNHATKD